MKAYFLKDLKISSSSSSSSSHQCCAMCMLSECTFLVKSACFKKLHHEKHILHLCVIHTFNVRYLAIRGLLFKFVDFLYSRSEVFDRVLNVISSKNIFFSLSFDV